MLKFPFCGPTNVGDTTSPTVVITSSEVSPTNAAPIPITITFSEAVTGFLMGDITVSGGSSLSNFSGSGAVYTVDVTPANGEVTVDIAGGVAVDAIGNSNTAAAQFAITYIGFELRDDFTDTLAAGFVNGTAATPGPGARTVVDTNSKISVGSGVLNFATGEASHDRVRYEIQARVAGKTLLGIMNMADTTSNPSMGWDTDTSGAILDRFLTGGSNLFYVYANSATAIAMGSYSTSTNYSIAAVMRATGMFWFIKGGAFTNWTFLYCTKVGTAGAYPTVAAANTISIFTADQLRIPSNLITITPLASDAFTRADGALGTTGGGGSEEAGGDGLTWTGSTFAIATNKAVNTPSLGSDLVVNGAFAADTDWTKGSGWTIAAGIATKAAGAAASLSESILTIGQWYSTTWTLVRRASNFCVFLGALSSVSLSSIKSASGTFTQTGRSTAGLTGGVRALSATSDGDVDDVSIKALTLSELFSATPANFLLAYLHKANTTTSIYLDKCVAGVYTNLITATVTYSAGARLVVVKDGTAVRVYYAEALVGTQATVSDAGITNNTLHGIFSTSSSNSLDNFVLWSRGTGGEYDASFNPYVA